MAVSSYLVTAHEQAHRSAAQTALRAAMPARARLQDRPIRRAVTRVEQAAQTGSPGQLLTEVLRVVESDRTRSQLPQVSERADRLLSFTQPPDQVEDFGYTERAAAAFEELGAQSVRVEALRAAIAADRPVQEWELQLLQADVPDLFAQWNTQPDPEVRGRVAERMSTVVDLPHDADSREPTYDNDGALYAYELAQSGEEGPFIGEKVERYRANLMRTYDQECAASQSARAAAGELNQPLTPDELAGRPVPTPPPDERGLTHAAYAPTADIWNELAHADPPDWINGPWPTHDPLPERAEPTGDWHWPSPAATHEQDTSEIDGGPDQEAM